LPLATATSTKFRLAARWRISTSPRCGSGVATLAARKASQPGLAEFDGFHGFTPWADRLTVERTYLLRYSSIIVGFCI
jgi:hypothetical protein